MKECLVLGCSFSAGSYIKDDRFSGTNDNFQNQIWQEKLDNRIGWYSYVDWLKDYNITVISTLAQGYATWAQFVHHLDNTGRLKRRYDKILIQETWEPRITFLQDKEVEELIKSNFVKCREVLDNIEHIILSGRGHSVGPDHYMRSDPVGKGMFTLLNLNFNALKRLFADLDKEMFTEQDIHNLVFNWLGHKIAGWCADEIQNLCKKNDIEGYVWSMLEPIMNCTHLRRIPGLKNHKGDDVRMTKVLTNHKLWTFYNSPDDHGHQTLEGNKLIAEYINEKMSNIRL
jgi:hypothetical protein